MKLIVAALVGALLTLAVVAGIKIDTPEPTRAPVPNTAANVGKCIQGHRVLWHESRGAAAEACLAQLGEVGEQQFSQAWHNFEIVPAHW
ncbi:hypothetical protein [Nocardioides sp. NPDC006273]|uniref:hypothetical protein n=1 Tax=Nocardioides sp. NPDC006273 TaxID=3155598 RepID=UPI0033A34DB6